MAQLGRYALIRRISSGGMGEVFLAHALGAEGFAKPVALKRIYPHMSANELHRRLFVREAKLVARLDHPNIVQVLELGTEGEELYMAMEFVHGLSLSRLLEHLRSEKRGLSPAQVGIIAFDLLDALEHAHTFEDAESGVVGVVHADVSPQNVMLNLQGLAKLCDFGIAQMLRDSTREITRRGVWGKIGYMSPEQLNGGTLDRRADVYAVGAVLFEALTCERLFSADNMVDLHEQVIKGDVPPLSRYRDDVPKDLEAAMRRALRARPEDRFQTAAEFRTVIEDVLITWAPGEARRELRELVRARYRPMDDSANPKTFADEEQVVTPNWKRLETRVHQARSMSPEPTDVTEVMRLTPPSPRHRRSRWAIAGLAAAAAVVALVQTLEPRPTEASPEPPSVARLAEAPPAAPLPEPSAPPADDDEEPARPERPAKKAKASAAAPALLTLNAVPWAYVVIDGQRLAKPTPIFDYALRPGRHVVVLEGPAGKRARLDLDLRPGEVVRKIVDLERAP